MPDGHHHDAGRQCLESPPGLVQCVCAPSCPDHWKPVNTSNIYIVIMTNYPSRCVEVMVCPTTTTAFFIEPLVLKRSTYLPSMMASAGVAREKSELTKEICGFEFWNTLKSYFYKLAILWRLRKSFVIRLQPWNFWTFFNTKEKNSHSKIWMKMIIGLPPWAFQFH